jgi:signal transduction histidine kinase
MSIRKKILLYFSVVTILLMGLSFLLIYTLLSEYREEEFQQRQKEKIVYTLKLLTEIEQMDERLALALDEVTIHDFYDEKMLIYDENKNLIYSSIDDLPIDLSNKILRELSPENQWIETTEEQYDVIGIYLNHDDESYYGISKAYDFTGLDKLEFLRYVLLLTFLTISLVIIFVSVYLSKRISKPITDITQIIDTYDFSKSYKPIESFYSENEVAILAKQFNKLMKRTNEAFAFQKNVVQHISHELKTPIAVLVSNFERIETETDPTKLKLLIANQKVETKSLSKIINALLDIAKAESGDSLRKENVRIDEIIFDLADELRILYPEFNFNITYSEITEDENTLTVNANGRLLKSALMNLMQNCAQYSSKAEADIVISTPQNQLNISFSNIGNTISDNERANMFQHFFRGENSRGKPGFGLGLVFVHKIMALHGGSITYESGNQNINTFIITLPLS